MRGAVAAGHPITAAAGARVLEGGGNAVDACIGAAFTAWVTESPLTGPGAGGFMLVHRARDGADFLLDFFVEVPGRGVASSRKPMEAVDIPFGEGDTTQRFLIDAPSCAVPGMVAGLEEAHRRYGTIPWPDLIAPAASLARSGIEITEEQALLHDVLDVVLRHDADGRRAYGANAPLRRGQRLIMDDLAGTLDALARGGAREFYRGSLGERISAEVRRRGGTLGRADLAAYRVIRRTPVRVSFRDHEMVSNPPPSSGGVLVAYALRLYDRLGAGGSAGSAEAIARLAEISREATRARSGTFRRDLFRGGLARCLLSDAAIEHAASAIRNRSRTAVAEPAGLPSTTHISVVDTSGNAASLSSSTGCGSGVVVPDTGIHLNNMLGEVDLNPSSRKAAVPGRRLTSMMAPSVLLWQGRPRLVVGSAGSERLRGAITQTIVNVVDHRMDLRAAIESPRAHLDGDELHCEAGTDSEAADELAELGYRVVRWPGARRNLYFGGVSAVAVSTDGTLEAAGDPRRGGDGVVVA